MQNVILFIDFFRPLDPHAEKGLTEYLPSQVIYTLRRLTALQMQNLYIGPQAESGLSHLKSPGLGSLCPGTEAKPDPIKGGLQVTSFFTYNCLAVSLSENEEHFLIAAACWLTLTSHL